MALRWKAFAPQTVAKAVEVQDLADNGVVQVDTSADLASPNLINANAVFVIAEMALYVRTVAGVGADKWQPVAAGANSVGSWAKVTGGTVTDYTKPDGTVMELHTFTADGTLTVVKDGLAEVLVVGGGGHGFNNSNSGGGGGGCSGQARVGLQALAAGALPVVIGAAGGYNEYGGTSKLGPLWAGGGAPGADIGNRAGVGAAAGANERAAGDAGGVMFAGVGYAGGCPGWDNGATDGTYGEGTWGSDSRPVRPNSGAGGRPGGSAGGAKPGAAGIVIVAVKK
jgi:hypothetical protein